jgi:hypothetical protein
MGVLTILGYIFGTAIVGVFGAKLYFKMIAGVCKSKRKLDGQVAVVTGANSGM